MNNKNQLNTISPKVSATKANKTRTKLLLIAQSEVQFFKSNPTKINSKSLKEIISEFESIEIEIKNPIEMGNAMQKMSYDKNDLIFNQTCSIVELNLNEEIIHFVENLNRKLFSERKLLKRKKNDKENNDYYSKKKSNRKHLRKKTSDEISTKEKKLLIKDSCHYLRKLCFNYIKKKRLRNKKDMTHQPKMPIDALNHMYMNIAGNSIANNDKDKRALQYSLKRVNSDNNNLIEANENGIKFKNKTINISLALPIGKDKLKKTSSNSLSGESLPKHAFRRNSEELSNLRYTFSDSHPWDQIKTTEFKMDSKEIIEDDNDNDNDDDNEEAVDDYQKLRQINHSKINNKQLTDIKEQNNRKLSEKEPFMSISFTKGILNES